MDLLSPNNSPKKNTKERLGGQGLGLRSLKFKSSQVLSIFDGIVHTGALPWAPASG